MRRLRWSLTISFVCALGCTGAEGDDDSTNSTRDAGFSDAGLGLDAGFTDAGPGRDAGLSDAGGTPDGGTGDGGPRDGGDPCAPIPRAEVGASLQGPLGRLVDRCVLELDGQESTQVGGWLSGQVEDILRDPALAYDDVAAGQCACDLETVTCDSPDPFRALGSCAAVITGTIAAGDRCTGYRCEAGLECWHQWEDAPVSCEGVCVRPRAAGEDCESPRGDPYPCEPGYFCFDDDGSFSCEPLIEVGEPCTFGRRCRGDRDAFLFPTTYCDFSKKVPTCEPRGRAMDDCGSAPCQDLFRCNANNQCVLKPRAGEACALSIANPTTSSDYRVNAADALDACIVNPTNASPGSYCVLTSTTTGDATCMPVPLATEACGIGVGRSAACDGWSICAGIDPSNLMPITGTCLDPIADGAVCNESWLDDVFGNQCANGTCDFGDPSVCGPYNPNGICIND